jgi:uncharacterized sodium:solute symporter family permease YidK
MSIVVSDIGAIDFVGISGQAYRYGVAVGNFDWIGSVPAMLLAAFIFVPYFWRAGLYTIPEYLGKRYNDYVRVVAAVTWIVFFAFNLGIIDHPVRRGCRIVHDLWRFGGSCDDRRGADDHNVCRWCNGGRSRILLCRGMGRTGGQSHGHG